MGQVSEWSPCLAELLEMHGYLFLFQEFPLKESQMLEWKCSLFLTVKMLSE